MTFNGPINGGTFNTGVMNNATYNGESSDKSCKGNHGTSQGFGDDSDKLDEGEGSLEGHQPGIGIQWLKFIKEHSNAFQLYSPEANNIIRSGKEISPRPYLDRDLYNEHVDSHEIESYQIPSLLREHIHVATNTDDLGQFKKGTRRISAFILTNKRLKQSDVQCLEFLEEFLIQVIKGYEAPYDYESHEDAFVWPYLDLIESMNRQLKASGASMDESSQYKSDGLIKLFGLKNLELLLLETSGHFSNTNKVKIKLDHQANSSDCIYNPEKYTRLSDIVNPVIIRLTKEEDGTGLSHLGPIFSPQHDFFCKYNVHL